MYELFHEDDLDEIEEIKGFPCIAYNKLSDTVKFGIKIIPLDYKFTLENHPCIVEIELLKAQ